MENQDYRVLLYYQYVTIEDPEQFAKDHLTFCNELGLKGRILVAEEGINGTVSGTDEATQRYMDAMHADERFAEMPFKVDAADSHAFQKMHVRHRPELVTLRLEDNHNPNEITGEHLEPKDWMEQMQREDTIVLDARNDYEYDLGHFRGAVRPDVETFKDLPDWVRDNQEMFEGKKVMMYCTGGIRCEKFSGWMMKEGFDVAQLKGGIATYGKDPEVKGQLWDGQMFVFDDRLTVPVNQVEHTIVGEDYFTGEPAEHFANCGNPDCDRRMIMTEENEHKFMRSCSHECRTHPRNRYVEEHGLSEEDVQARLEKIEEEATVERS
ncbi:MULTISPECIES: oxygen-dependent tRNA uridine(34) hydroxylase TrhO [Pontibacillus]|uniref:tRNA uridine(34) hydroxylase n=1 Tax=Pontibacillus chungwhensis TaxID=265426 RepID=A0ABY8V0T9_9BACI|nr:MULTISPECIES: rhodanese-related sulfurtransferase [Pontibacillus]MCD5324447.1 rhodanese-related sulfurtransferase [Pontibacillus sp. HN14]WIF99258.1 rhodanese-related sulfurtransferase [Pontibacillus chungwhensis]